MQHYNYFNEKAIDYYYNQLCKELSKKTKTEKTGGINLWEKITLKNTVTEEFEYSKPGYLEKLNKLLDELSARNEISINRPSTEQEYKSSPEFIYEKISATKLIISARADIKELFDIRQVVVWIADPIPEQLSKKSHPISGSFLYLIQNVVLSDNSCYGYSGRTALQLVGNIINKRPVFDLDRDEKLGSGSNEHPLKKLKGIGAIPVGKTDIETLYIKSYYSNEQLFAHNDNEYRCNDILGCPLFIGPA